MMGKLPLGVVSPYVKMSSGGCSDPLKFYATSYCTAYGREDFQPKMGTHRGTGWKANYRPLVSYQPSLDALDNPAMGEQVQNVFQTMTNQSYRPLEVPDGKDPLPSNMYQTCSGYGREQPNTGPSTKEVRKVHFNTQDHGAHTIPGLEPREVPLLHQQQDKGSTEWENSRHGPRFMTSEYNSKYLNEPPTQPDLLQKKSIGAKEETGFTEGSTKNPIVFKPPSQALPGSPVSEAGAHVQCGVRGWALRYQSAHLCCCGESTEQPLNSPGTVQGHRILPPKTLIQPFELLLSHTATSVQTCCRFFENIPKGLDREGWTRGGIQPQKPGSYALNHPVPRGEPTPTPTESLQGLHPHVGRTLTHTDPFYQNTPHSSRFTPPRFAAPTGQEPGY
ncbi:protein phosphatase 1 regulatory subunit 32 [Echinops telfairi]|uniref:Protein phosphatase 1 regulatory subunit 32 n=1 Tax=Echinops telfairi TaxID=9371 RepID=A0AC55DMK9_ECHTE|nr:protein phosphatase 1 regulatory subunit 32 [Echinops telfairi]